MKKHLLFLLILTFALFFSHQVVTAQSLPGDANGDGSIDLVDFNIWRDEFSGTLPTKQADFNTDGKVDLIDFNIWLTAYKNGGTTVQNQPTLLESYILTNQYAPRANDPTRVQYNYQESNTIASIYRPRQFANGLDTKAGVDNSTLIVANPGPYAGWDVFTLNNTSVIRFSSGDQLFKLNLNRPAQVAIVWRGPITLPNWLQSWTKDVSVSFTTPTGTTVSYPTYRKSLPAGEFWVGGIYNTAGQPAAQTYMVLFAESSGQPSPEPITPAGKEKPLANQTCPTWVHDQYVTTGPDGKTYPTWHPQIDPVNWCYFRHDHGANPDYFVKGYKPAYNYTALKHVAAGEPHVGFKTAVFDDANGNTWLITLHFGTGGLARVCNRFHSLDIAVRKTNSTEVLADIHLMGDFGQAVHNATDQLLKPPACPTQGEGVPTRGEEAGQRRIPAGNGNTQGYEPWPVGAKGNILGFKPGWHINTYNPMVICDLSPTCANPLVTGKKGVLRFFADSSLLGIIAGTNTGDFYTNTLGTQLSSALDQNALKQFVKAGTSAQYPANSTKCYDTEGFGRKHVCHPSTKDGFVNFSNDLMREIPQENAIQAPN